MRKFIAAYLIANVIMALVGTAIILSTQSHAQDIQSVTEEQTVTIKRTAEPTKRFIKTDTPHKRTAQ